MEYNCNGEKVSYLDVKKLIDDEKLEIHQCPFCKTKNSVILTTGANFYVKCQTCFRSGPLGIDTYLLWQNKLISCIESWNKA